MCFTGSGLLFFVNNSKTKCRMTGILLILLSNLWHTQHLYLCINNGLYSCNFWLFKAEARYRWWQFRTRRMKTWHFTKLTAPLPLTLKITWYNLSIPPFDTLWTKTEVINRYKNISCSHNEITMHFKLY